MKIFIYILSGLLTLGLLFGVGCRRDMRHLESTTDGLVKIDLKWPSGVAELPKTVKYAFYDQDGKLVRQVDKKSLETLVETFPEGKYRVIIYNTDAQNVDYRSMDSYAQAEVFTPVMANKATIHSVIQEPGKVFAVGKCNEFEMLNVIKNTTTQATANPVSLTKHISIKFSILNVSDIMSVVGFLNGVAEGVFLSTGKFNWVTAGAVAFTCAPEDASKQSYIAEMEVFDIITTSESQSNSNSVDVTLSGPSGYHDVHVDITDVIKDLIEHNSGVIPIEIPVEVKIEMTELGVLTATVQPWDQSGTGGGGITARKTWTR